jgi:flagellar FliL protein
MRDSQFGTLPRDPSEPGTSSAPTSREVEQLQTQWFPLPLPVFLTVSSDSLLCGLRLAFSWHVHMTNITQNEWKGSQAGSRVAKVLLLMLALLSAPDCKKPTPASESHSKDTHGPQIKGVLHLESFVVNLADPEDNRFLRVGIDLGLGNPPPGKGGEGDVPTARIRDCILAVLSTWHSEALLAPEGKEKLKDELLHSLQLRVPELGVKEIYFTDFLVQR